MWEEQCSPTALWEIYALEASWWAPKWYKSSPSPPQYLLPHAFPTTALAVYFNHIKLVKSTVTGQPEEQPSDGKHRQGSEEICFLAILHSAATVPRQVRLTELKKDFFSPECQSMTTWVPPTWLRQLSPEGKAEYDVLETTANNAFNTCAQPAMLLPLCISMHLFLAFSCCCWDAICCFPTPALKPVQLELGITCLPSGAVAAAAKIWIYRYKVL